MIAIVTTILGAIWGFWQARRAGGNRMDMAQYTVGFGIIGMVVGLFAFIILARIM